MIELIYMACFAVFLAWWFEPLNTLKTNIIYGDNRFARWIDKRNINLEFIFCSKCVGFWMALALTFNVFESAFVAFIAFIISEIITKITTYESE